RALIPIDVVHDDTGGGDLPGLPPPGHLLVVLSTASSLPEPRAQWAQQYIDDPSSIPWPRIRHPQCAQLGASL
ncbi:MAG TPA: hypothetical protein VFO28_01250, partial [Burkholderiaceae bacterium]|nr:hypothetical protein [Burkholderiaceae bacterium]